MNALLKSAQADAAAFVTGNPMRLDRRIKPSYKTMIELLYQWHDDCKDDKEMMHMSTTLEDVADQLKNAHDWANEERDLSPDDGWMKRQDAAVARSV